MSAVIPVRKSDIISGANLPDLTEDASSDVVSDSVSHDGPGVEDSDDVEIRLKIDEMSRTDLRTITLKMPGDFNHYIDSYIHEHWKEKVRKQDLLKRAMQLLVYELETGQELVDLDPPARPRKVRR
jgi:hypothetical protein